MNSEIILCNNINVDRDYKNVLNYTESQMVNLCRTNAIKSANDYSFIRPQNTIFVEIPYSDALQSTYIAFQNSDYSNKWFFGWIDDVILSSNGACEIKYTIDAWSTWFSYWIPKSCWVNREHVNDDTIGLNTIPENLAVEEVVQENLVEETAVYGWQNQYGDLSGYYVVMETNWLIKDNSHGSLISIGEGTQYDGVAVHNNVVSGNQYVVFPINSIGNYANVSLYIMRTNYDKHIEDIKNIFIVPRALLADSDLSELPHTAWVVKKDVDTQFQFYTLRTYSEFPKKFNTIVNKLTAFTDYTPKNNKCFVYPYNYILLSNNNGSHNIYKYENFNSENCVFENQLALTKGVSGRIVPKNYKGMSYADDESLAIGKYPLGSWSSDAYINWLTTNGVNLAVKIGVGALGAAAGIGLIAATGGAAAAGAAALGETALAGAAGSAVANTGVAIGNAAISTASSIAGGIGEFVGAKILPNIEGGQATGDILWAANRNVPSFRQMRAKTEYLRIIDEYFTRFGYKINRLKVPNITGRRYWNYVEIASTEDIISGNVPTKFAEIINGACRNGVTIWHDNENVGNYLLDNEII